MTELTVSHAVGEILASPQGTEIGAFFDLDGTLIEGFSARAFAEARFRSREVGVAELGRSLRVGADYIFGRAGFEDVLAVSGQAFKGRPNPELVSLGDLLFETKIAKLVYRDVRRLVEAHQERGHTVALASSATSFQAQPVATALGIERVICNRMAVDQDDLLTGELVSPVIWGGSKADAVQDLARQAGVDLGRSFFYADGDEDVALMHLVGRPRPVNPRKRLEAVARRRGWPVLRVSSTSMGTLGRLRNAAGVAALVPAVALGAAVGLVRRDKRAALNTIIPTWIDLLFAATGVRIDVVTGREHLKSPRPAVFIFNHKNNWDSFVAMRLVATNVTGVAKKELAKDPVFRTLGAWMDVVFVDRSDTAAAVAQMKSLEQLTRKGLSVIVAPEGTRSPTGELGPFKKGAFRLAMATGLPIVPIVVGNAEVLGDPDTTAIRPGRVAVAILNPVRVDDWTLDDLDKRIDGVRQLYLDTLDGWPGPG